tara:strand:- start:13653 stop:14384 length:732 start_codon:yes stop_codon:yes gene_type:complete
VTLTNVQSGNAEWENIIDANIPESTETHKPIKHSTMVDWLDSSLEKNNIKVVDRVFNLSKNTMRMMALYQVEKKDEKDKNTLVGLLNCNEKTYAAKLMFGLRWLTCGNRLWYESVLFKRKHTGNITQDLELGISNAISNITIYQNEFDKVINKYKEIRINDEIASHAIVNAASKKIIPSSKVVSVYREWFNPSYTYDHNEKSLYRLNNAFTTSFRNYKSPFSVPKRSFGLIKLLGEYTTKLES